MATRESCDCTWWWCCWRRLRWWWWCCWRRLRWWWWWWWWWWRRWWCWGYYGYDNDTYDIGYDFYCDGNDDDDDDDDDDTFSMAARLEMSWNKWMLTRSNKLENEKHLRKFTFLFGSKSIRMKWNHHHDIINCAVTLTKCDVIPKIRKLTVN